VTLNFPRVTLSKFLEFMDRLGGVEKVDKSKLAKSLGYKSVHGIASHISTALSMELIDIHKDNISLTEIGEKFCVNDLLKKKIVADFLLDEEKGLGKFTKSLQTKGRRVTTKEIRTITMLFVEKEKHAEILAGNLIEWYGYANLFKKRGDSVESYLILAKQIGVISNYFVLQNVERKLYMGCDKLKRVFFG